MQFLLIMFQNSIAYFKRLAVTSVVLFGLAACGGSQVVLLNDITQDIANNIVLLLGDNNISATKQLEKDGNYSISVDQKDQIKALALLKTSGEPSTNFVSMGEIFKKDGFISSPLEEHARLIYALDQEISAMLSGLNGVVSVDTQVSLPIPSDKLYSSDTDSSKVAVLIKYKQNARVDLYVNRIKNLVSNAVPGVIPSRVEVLTVVQKDI